WALILATLPVALWLTADAAYPASILLWILLLFNAGAASRGLTELARRWFQRRTRAYVVTNQRCFQLAVLGPMVQVVDLQEVLEDSHLPAAEVVRLYQALHDPSRAPREEASADTAARETLQTRLARLPQRLRERVHHALHPGE